METYNHAITEDEAGIITIRDTITKLSADGKKNVPEVFHKFRKTWNAVWPHLGNLLGCARAAASITDFELMEEVSIKCCLPGTLFFCRSIKLTDCRRTEREQTLQDDGGRCLLPS
jgi:hypothetical protein